MKKLIMPICFAVLLSALSGCGGNKNPNTTQTPAPATPSMTAVPSATPSAGNTVSDYFPILENVQYIYQGEGNEYAGYDVFIDYTDDTKIQQRLNNGGTVVSRVIAVTDEQAVCVYRREESYFRENHLNKTDGIQDVLLMAPIEAGASWGLEDGLKRTITDVSAEVETPSGTYSAVAVETEYDGGKTTWYYAKGVGLVKTVSSGEEGYEVLSVLSEIRKETPFVQTVRFYYPNAQDGKIYYKDKELGFKTNEITRLSLEEAYRTDVPDTLHPVLTENTKINSLYLNDDGSVYLDLSGEFLTEMNAGSGLEAMILQCVANTFGSYYGTDGIILTVDGSPYTSGHISLTKGELLSVNTEGAAEIP